MNGESGWGCRTLRAARQPGMSQGNKQPCKNKKTDKKKPRPKAGFNF
ncbi:hypothetical protein [Candidatus Avelusimicrobium facis]